MSSHHYQGTSAPTGEIEHINFLSENIGALFLNDEYSDVVLVVDGAHFHAHKVILAARSEYFRALLFGGMRESTMPEIELKATPLPAFRSLLKYIYTGQMALANQKEDVVLDILGLAHQYGFIELEASVSDYLREVLSVRNACQVLDAAKLYQLQHLATVCLSFLDAHAPAVMATEAFTQLSLGALRELLTRDSFYASEMEVFSAVARWTAVNGETAAALSLVRLPLLSVTELLTGVRPLGLATPDALLDAIQLRTSCPDSQLPYRGSLVVDENVAAARLGTQVLQGEMRAALLDGDSCNYDMEKGYTRHAINEAGDHGILVKLGKQAIVNHIKMLLWDKDLRSYSYYVEASMDQRDWVRIVDHTGFYCRSWQRLYFPARVVRFLRIVGTHNTVNKVFHVVSLEVSYALNCPPLVKGLVAPTENVATIACSASVLEGVSRSRNALLNGDTRNYDWDSGYTCHQLGSGAILVQLGQPYMIGSAGLLLWDCDERSYGFFVEVSANQWDWDVVADRTKEACRSWQRIEFTPRPVAFVRITGTHNTANEVFHCVHFECPAQQQPATSTTMQQANTPTSEAASSPPQIPSASALQTSAVVP